MVKKIFLAAVFLAAIGIYTVWHSDSFQRRYLYPYPYRQTVEYYADRYEIDKNLVAATILAESKFDTDAVSHPGAIGLMQVMPDTGKWIANQIEDDDFTLDRLNEPEMNIKYGTWYMASLQEEFGGNKVLALAAYNAGRGNVHEWIELYGWDERTFDDYTQIPFPETREYVKRVLDNEQNYAKLYK